MEEAHKQVTTGQPLSPAFPARWFTTYSVFSPVRPGFVVTVARENSSTRLAPASGRQDHTTSPSAKKCRSSRDTSASTASRLAFVTTRPPLILSRDSRQVSTISEKKKEGYFCEK